MKIKSIFLLSFIVLLISCDSLTKKNYTLLLHSKQKGILGIGMEYKTDSTVSEYESDSAAYYYGKMRYEIGVAFEKELKLGKEYYDFEVLNEQREDIKYKLSAESIAEMDKRAIEAAKNSGKDLKSNLNKPKENQKVIDETPQIKELKKKFRIKKDEFDDSNIVWYKPISSPNFVNRNGFFCYFGTENGRPIALRIVHQYYADDWLFIRKYKFSIDGNAYSYSPIDVKTDNGDGGMIWEWSDEVVDSDIKEMLNALINSKSAKIRLEGRQYYDTKSITSSQIKSIKETIELYKLMGGDY
jgi:hypothetical protein